MVLAGEQRLALQHLSEDAASTPDIHFHIILLPCEHDFRRSVVSRGDIAGHLRVLYTCQAEIADLEVAIFVHEDVGGFEVSVDDAGRVDVFQTALGFVRVRYCFDSCLPTHQNLIEEVLDELFLERSRREESMEIGAEEFGDCRVVRMQ
jgi:hypothetical protein